MSCGKCRCRHTNAKEFPERLPGGTSLAQTTRPTNPRDIFRYSGAPPKPARTWPIPPAQKSTLTLNTGAIRKAEKAWSACCGQTSYNNSDEDPFHTESDLAFCVACPESMRETVPKIFFYLPMAMMLLSIPECSGAEVAPRSMMETWLKWCSENTPAHFVNRCFPHASIRGNLERQ